MSEAIVAELREISSYLREIASVHRRADLDRILSDTPRQRAYVLTDGGHTQKEIAADAQVQKTVRTISTWWSEWIDSGLADRAEDGSVSARYDLHVLQVSDDDA